MKTAIFRFDKAMLGRAPLSVAEKTPGLNTRGDNSYAALELEARRVLAVRYADVSKLAKARVNIAGDLLQARSPNKAVACRQFDVQNQALEEFSRMDYEAQKKKNGSAWR